MKPKIPAVRVDSDSCVISIGQIIEDGKIVNPGVPHYVHTGEWVEVLPVMTVREVMQISRLQNSAGSAAELGENLTELCRELSRRVIAWNWTDLMGEPMGEPHKNPEVLEGLSSEELIWLMSAANGGESADARKKDLDKLESISLETAPSPKG